MRSSSKGSAASLYRTTASVSSVDSFVNRLTTSKLTIWLEWMGSSLILSTKWAEFLTYDEDLRVCGLMISTKKRFNGWHAEPRLLTMGLYGIPFWWIFRRSYMCGTLSVYVREYFDVNKERELWWNKLFFSENGCILQIRTGGNKSKNSKGDKTSFKEMQVCCHLSPPPQLVTQC